MYDLVIRGGSVVDGLGGPAATADVGIQADRIAEIGRGVGRGRREIEAAGLLVTPGWVDVHTHYDGQVSWDSELTPSCWHGVTTAVMGNCGVGFAPAAPGRHEWLIHLMEGVEDIPGTALAEGIAWEWESFPEYLDAIDRRHYTLDIGAQLPHGALRAYVMGERGADHTETPSPDEIETMARLAGEAVRAGALGFSTSRTTNHRTRDGEFTPSLTAGEEELVGIARGLGQAGLGVFEAVADFRDCDREFALLEKMVQVSGRPLSLSIAQADAQADGWRDLLDRIDRAVARGLPMKAQVPVRAIGLMLGLSASLHPFSSHPSYRSVASLPLRDRLARLRDPELRARILAESPAPGLGRLVWSFERIFSLGDPPDYEPSPDQSLAAQAKRLGVEPAALAYYRLLEDDGQALLYRPLLNYCEGNLDVTREMLLSPNTVPGLGDAGAHCGMICDGSFPTFLLAHWGRQRSRGERLPLEWLVRRQTHDTASLVGLGDRGALSVGLRADLNLIDLDQLGLQHPRVAYDLPAGGKRLLQGASGYVATVVAGAVTFEHGEPTGAHPGRLVRGARQRDAIAS